MTVAQVAVPAYRASAIPRERTIQSMTEILKKLLDSDATCEDDAREIILVFLCPGCGAHHSFRIKSTDPGRPVWQWDGNMEKPTFSPSLLVNQHRPESRCHSFVRSGRIEFLSDCFHELKGQTVDLPPHEWD